MQERILAEMQSLIADLESKRQELADRGDQEAVEAIRQKIKSLQDKLDSIKARQADRVPRPGLRPRKDLQKWMIIVAAAVVLALYLARVLGWL